MATISPSFTVNAMTDTASFRGTTRTPGGAVDEHRPRVRRERAVHDRVAGHLLRATEEQRGGWAPRAAVGAQHDIRMQHRDERVEVAVARRREERVDDLALAGRVAVGRRRLPHAPACAAGELARRGRRAGHDQRDLVERHREHVVQDERQPLGRRQGVEHDEQREPDRIGEYGLVLGIDGLGPADDGVGHVDAVGLLGP